VANEAEAHMSNILERLKSIFRDRRHRNDPHPVERRSRPTNKQARKRLSEALEDFERTVTNYRPPDHKEFSANDMQQEVQFDTFRAICRFKMEQGQFNLCRNPAHEAANTGIAKCEEYHCPFMRVQREPT
jgi:hypothetical protein